MTDWKPDLYMRFNSERTQPSIDLIYRIAQVEPKSIIDIGCGPGNSTRVLVNRWPKSKIIGIDSSAAMIQKARQDYPNQEWVIADATSYEPEIKFDIVFSNAAIQWIPNHEALLMRFYSFLSDRGIVAIQIPQFWDMSLGQIINNIANKNRWRERTAGISSLFTIENRSFYYDILSKLFSSIEMWETQYMHILESHGAIIEMMRSTGLKPYLEKIDNDADKEVFEGAVLEEIKKAYPIQKNGKVILPFKRLFFIGYR
ncbi:MAG: methyltransferase domain-containing protein [Desulfobacterales bacterium]|nr:methyltransferase domain-containing protein [Desulfobacterales bacterium]